MSKPLAIGVPLVCVLAAACNVSSAGPAPELQTVAENRVTFYTTYGHLDDGSWSIPMRIWVHEEPDAARRLLARQARNQLLQRSALETLARDEEDRYMHRVHGFIADSESGERVRFQFDDDPDRRSHRLLAADPSAGTDRNGLIEGRLSLTAERARILLEAQGATDGWLSFRAVSKGHGGRGRLRLIPPAGLSVISDVDDTAKVTNIPAGHAEVIANTFFLEFVAAPCMAEMYRDFGEDVAFHYVSGSPWQLYEPLRDFLLADPPGFPAGSFHMKSVRTNLSEADSYSDIWRLVAGGSEQATFDQKIEQIGTLLSHFPERTFVLIGDSGEQDPEVFAALRKRFSRQISEIRIRDVVDDRLNDPERLSDMSIIVPQENADGPCSP